MFRRSRRSFRRFPAVQRAAAAKVNRLMQHNPAEAGALLAEQARQMHTSKPRLSANLHARAAHAFVEGGDGQAALVQAREALALFLQYDMPQRAQMFMQNITHRLEESNMSPAADALKGEFAARIPPAPMQAGSPIQWALLPTNCPNCGAAVYSETVEWVDANTAECDYCGSLVRAGS